MEGEPLSKAAFSHNSRVAMTERLYTSWGAVTSI